ncbi:MAG: D-2-hydroxyacid dehydrogenase [Lewinellaceae bacterium]|nr:D-2-hydroxyacid dehydrogenase [Lewinellaceae bacterium]
MPKIVVLDGHTMNPGDLSWEKMEALGELSVYTHTPPTLVGERAKDAEIILTNKVVLDQSKIRKLPNLKCISVMATGFNVVDVGAAREHGVVVCNVRRYATDSVAQHVFALLLGFWSKISLHNKSVTERDWQKSPYWSYNLSPTTELAGKIIGIYGLGQIGRKVAQIALAFGMEVLSHHKHPLRDKMHGVAFTTFEEMLQRSDVITLHAPLTVENEGIINRTSLSKMKPTAILINTGRGGLIVEQDLKDALEDGRIAGAGLDVLSEEPPKDGNILIGVPNCIITPHNAWATKESRARLLEESVLNVEAFLAGRPRNEIGK